MVSEHRNKRKIRKAQEAGLQGPDQDVGDTRGHVYAEESSDFEYDRPAPKKRKWRRG